MTEPPVVEPTSGVTPSSFEEIQRTPERSTSASQASEAFDSDVNEPSETAAEQPLPSQVSSARNRYTPTTTTTSATATEPATTLRRRRTHQTPSSEQPQDPADDGTSEPSTSSKTWDFFVQKLVPICGFLGLILAVAFGIGAWIGMNYANSYSKKQYDIALFSACHDYEDMGATSFCQKIITAGLNSADLVKRAQPQECDCPPIPPTADEVAWQELYEFWAPIAHRVKNTPIFYAFWTLPMSIQNGGTLPESDGGLRHSILAWWSTTLYVVWQIILLGSSRFALGLCVHLAGEFLASPFPRFPVIAALMVPLLSFDAIYVLASHAPAHLVATFWVLLVLGLFGLLFWVGMEDDDWAKVRAFIRDPSNRQHALTSISVIFLFINFFPCWLMTAVRGITLFLWSLVTLAFWGNWAGDDEYNPVAFAGFVAAALATLLDLFHPNFITALWYEAYCR
ncbi:hypothetical protein HK57_00325 [Aspergillus ustus]|uniref:Uncharacterized protein n=1 Tax=Aspergillus ustus TaxID=40382 RepID=A0A0C1E6Y0_ASPUT|nr:hypothetical protein HK57_00325 [Aspergillus ustus]